MSTMHKTVLYILTFFRIKVAVITLTSVHSFFPHKHLTRTPIIVPISFPKRLSYEPLPELTCDSSNVTEHFHRCSNALIPVTNLWS